MKKMLKVFAVALLTVSLMVSMAMNVTAEEAMEAIVEVVESEQAFAEEAIAVEEPVLEEITIEEQIAEETTEEATIEAQVIEETSEVVEEVVEEAVEVVVAEVVEEAVEAPVRTVSFTFSWEGDKVAYGDEIKLVPILSGYEGANYELVWQYSTDNANWIDYTTGDASYTLTEENVSWYWRLVVNTVEDQAA